MKNSSLKISFLILICTFVLGFFAIGPVSPAQGGTGSIFDVREIETAGLGALSPAGLAFSPLAGVFEIIDSGSNGVSNPALVAMTMFEKPAGTAAIQDTISNPINLAFNSRANSLYILNLVANSLDQIPADASGTLPQAAEVAARYNATAYGLQSAEGLSFNPADGRLYILDPDGKAIIRITPDASSGYDGDSALKDGRIEHIDLKHLGASGLRGIAFNPNSNHLYVLDPIEKVLFELSEAGGLVNTYDVSAFTLNNPQAMVFAPSGDPTDDPSIQDLFIADNGLIPGQDSRPGQILELSITQAVVSRAQLMALQPVSLVQTSDNSRWSPPSPDSSGIDYNPTTGRFLVSDSEVEELPIYEGKNIFEMSPQKDLTGTCTTLSFSKEPTGVAVNPDNGHVFISDDDKDRVFEVDTGRDNTYCTDDDSVTWINNDAFDIVDSEGVAFGQGNLFVADGLGKEIYRIDPGPNGQFDGLDDTSTHFDTSSMGLLDPEGIGYHPDRNSLFIVSRHDDILVETSLNGAVLNVFDISSLNAHGPAGVGCGPGSDDPSVTNVYIAARGVDNNNDPNENDGKIYEVSVDDTAPVTNTPTRTPRATRTPTPTQTGTPNPTETNTPTPTSTSSQGNSPTQTPTPTQTSTQNPIQGTAVIYLPFINNANNLNGIPMP